nr:immunoglobulin light chain junction region [Macaca mulatta]MOW02341.1 immunoglobulin light chain junction region [Macaca mulatta]MOW02685.1 immunoglobulin light chain junction region [Macaca mulatta]MOW03673.1 immunoglobulin light chain junction region [Macaca mulatta]
DYYCQSADSGDNFF